MIMLWCNVNVDPVSRLSKVNRGTRNVVESVFLCRPRQPRIVVLNENGGTPARETVRVEAEECSSLQPNFRKSKANHASGQYVLEIPEGSGKGLGQVKYVVDVPETGWYIITARVFWTDGCSNSLGFVVNGQNFLLASDVFNQWHELSSQRAVELSKGTHEVVVRNTEDGVRLDWWSLRKTFRTDP